MTSQRSLVVLCVPLESPGATRSLLAMLPQLTTRHLVLVAAVTNPDLLEAAADRSSRAAVYRAAAAERALLDAERRARLKGASLNVAAQQVASQLDIAALLDAPIGELSVGQQQRVAAARALIGSPEVVIADEPTSALDTDRREQFLQLLFASCASAGATLLFVSHDHTLMPLFSRVVSLGDINRAAAC
jgi:ABC-type Mn2+/Zn2+ transport system ATPase subunit